MPSKDLPRPRDPLGRISRRGFLRGAAALAVTQSSLALTQGQANSSNGSILAYVGTYSAPHQGPEGGKSNGQGIYLFQMNPETGALSPRKLFADDSNPSWLAFDSSRTHLYATNEISTFQGTHSGSVSAFSIDRSNGDLTLLNTVSSQGAGPTHLSVHPSGKYVLVANFAGGTVAVLPIRSNGELGSATDVKRDPGTVRSTPPTSAPPRELCQFQPRRRPSPAYDPGRSFGSIRSVSRPVVGPDLDLEARYPKRHAHGQ